VFVPRDLLGTVRLRVTSSRPVFVGDRARERGQRLPVRRRPRRTEQVRRKGHLHHLLGRGTPSPPTAQSFWSASTLGSGTHTLKWTPQPGNWRIVLMNTNGSSGVSAEVSIGARIPHLLTISVAILGAGILLLLLTSGAIYLIVRERRYA
jgi:hypothetical protein